MGLQKLLAECVGCIQEKFVKSVMEEKEKTVLIAVVRIKDAKNAILASELVIRIDDIYINTISQSIF